MNSTRLFILGLISKAPRHGYEIQRWLEVNQTDVWANILPGSIYHALKQLEKEGYIQVLEQTLTGHRQKAIYAITDDGQLLFQRLLQEAFAQPPRTFPAHFYVALTFWEDLPTSIVRRLIDELIPKLEHEIANWEKGESLKDSSFPLPEHVQALFMNGREHLQADLRLLHTLRTLLEQQEGETVPEHTQP